MPNVYPERRSIRPALVIVTLLVILGIIGFLVVRSGNDLPRDRNLSSAEPASVPDFARPVEAPSAPPSAQSRSTASAQASSSAGRPGQPWQISVQPAVVAAIRNESLSAYQVQMDRWSCEGQQCVGNLRIPPTVEAGRQGDISAPANIFDRLKEQMGRENVDVSLLSIQPSPEGLAVAFQFTPNAVIHGRYYTDAEIAAIRLESLQQGRKEAQAKPDTSASKNAN